MRKTVLALGIIMSIVLQSTILVGQSEYDGWYEMKADNLPEITSLKVSSALDVYVYSDTKNHFKILAKEDTDYSTRYEVINGQLKLYQENKSSSWFENNKQEEVIFLYLKPELLKEIIVSGASDVVLGKKIAAKDFKVKTGGASDLNFYFTGDKLALKCSGSSDITAEVKASLILSEISGASDVYLKGSAITHKVELSGASDLEAKKLDTKLTEIVISGASDADITAKKITKQVSGSSEVETNGASNVTTIKGKHFSVFDDFSNLDLDFDVDISEDEDGTIHIKIGDFIVDIHD